jgi:hypothetical protein
MTSNLASAIDWNVMFLHLGLSEPFNIREEAIGELELVRQTKVTRVMSQHFPDALSRFHS